MSALQEMRTLRPDQRMVNAIREMLGLEPLYGRVQRERARDPGHLRVWQDIADRQAQHMARTKRMPGADRQ